MAETETTQESTETTGELTWKGFIETQDEKIRDLYNQETHGLKTALDSEREARKETEGKLRELAKNAEAGSEAQKEISKYADKLASIEGQNKFYDQAHNAGVKNLKLAWIAGQEFKTETGEIEFEKLKVAYPELFTGVQTIPVNAGSGTNTPGIKGDFNTTIRKATGR